jgi:hypothetical protein
MIHPEEDPDFELTLKNSGTDKNISVVFGRQLLDFEKRLRETRVLGPDSNLERERRVNVHFDAGECATIGYMEDCDPASFSIRWFSSSPENVLLCFQGKWNNAQNSASQPSAGAISSQYHPSRKIVVVEQKFGKAQRFYLSTGTSNSGANFPDTYFPTSEPKYNTMMIAKLAGGWVPKTSLEGSDLLKQLYKSEIAGRTLSFMAHKHFTAGTFLGDVVILKDLWPGDIVELCDIKKISALSDGERNDYRIVTDTFNEDYFSGSDKIILYHDFGSQKFSLNILGADHTVLFPEDCETRLLLARFDFLDKFSSWQQIQISWTLGGSSWNEEGGALTRFGELVKQFDYSETAKELVSRFTKLERVHLL